MDDQLKLSHQRLSTALKPSWDDLASVLLTIKGYWADTVSLIAKAVEFSNKIKIPGFTSDTDLEAKRSALGQVNARLPRHGLRLLHGLCPPLAGLPWHCHGPRFF